MRSSLEQLVDEERTVSKINANTHTVQIANAG
jgi:hypothetical protein